MDLGFKGKKALVMGSSQGLGAGIARSLAKEGCDLILTARRADVLATLAAEIRKESGVNVEVHPIDLTDTGAVSELCNKIRTEYVPDILINNGGGPPPSTSTGVSNEIWAQSVQVLLYSVIQISEAAVEGMRGKNWGRILTIASSGVQQPIPNLAVSNTVRSAVVGFSKTLASEVGKDGITVNVIIPGKIDTERVSMLDKAASERQNKPIEAVRTQFKANIPVGRYGKVEEFANVATFLVSEQASYVTGHMVRVDGGSIRGV